MLRETIFVNKLPYSWSLKYLLLNGPYDTNITVLCLRASKAVPDFLLRNYARKTFWQLVAVRDLNSNS